MFNASARELETECQSKQQAADADVSSTATTAVSVGGD